MGQVRFRLTGIVRSRATRAGVPGLRVEAWDRDTRFHDMLGVDITDGEGRFEIRFDDQFFGDFAPDRLPDVYFRVVRDDQLLRSTEDSIIRNMREGDRDVVIEIDPPVEPEAAEDRVSAGQVYAAVSWFKASDFRGVFEDGKDRVATIGRLGGEMFRGMMARASLAPLAPPAVKERDVVGQDVVTAGANLARQNVAVHEVKAYAPGERVEAIGIARTPVGLKPGDRVTLYQDSSGVVRYYTLVREPAPKDIRADDVARIDREVKAVRADLTQLATVRASVDEARAAAEARSAEIDTRVEGVRREIAGVERLKSEIDVLRRSAVERERQVRMLLDEVAVLRGALDRLAPGPRPAPPVQPVTPGRPDPPVQPVTPAPAPPVTPPPAPVTPVRPEPPVPPVTPVRPQPPLTPVRPDAPVQPPIRPQRVRPPRGRRRPPPE